ncbi:MAG: histidine kinase [Rhodospirillaceae bacterium]|jgi:two-component system sensor histidine kinase ChvG|nr:histidine kinase [Rhodospirillaceae bacterium]|tara:strand:+ start:330 stop:1970 length:1641 start_codon:yes stop_codon:yes gene_type:complete
MAQESDQQRKGKIKPRPGGRVFSPLTRRILTVNVIALGVLVSGILFLGEYRRNLIDAELKSLGVQAEMFAAALGEGAVTPRSPSSQQLVSEISNQIVRRLVETTGTRARLFSNNGSLIADSRRLVGPGGLIQIEALPPPGAESGVLPAVLEVYDRLMRRLTVQETLQVYHEKSRQHARDYPEVVKALLGERAHMVRNTGGGRLILSVAMPVQRYKHVLGALMLTRGSHAIDSALLEVRLDILKIFAVALGVTVLLSMYLAGTIVRPVRRLAAAAERVRRDHGRQQTIPDFAGRNDEIGDLAESLSEMTEALWLRMDAIESFAADVAHEIKNPLTSLRSAVETTARLKDPEQQRKLMVIIQEDVSRLDRLISDISDASRLDAELSRAETEPVDIGAMLAILVEVHDDTTEGGPRTRLENTAGDSGPLMVDGIESRLAQVFRNLLTNARSFSPGEGAITITTSRENGWIVVDIDDDGPGIPAGKEEAIFKRFYTQRRKLEKFGTHSGLGLSISRQIIDAHGGRLFAANRTGPSGEVLGARFSVRLPAG